MTEPLTTRQSQLLAFLREQIAVRGMAPSVWEICNHFGFASPTSAAKLLNQLEEKGAIAREPGAHRAIRLLDVPPASTRPQIPLIGRIAAGVPITAGEHVAEMIDVDPGVFSPRADLLLRVHGESMIGKGILPNDLVGVHLQREVRNGQIVAAVVVHPRTDDPELTIKTYRRQGSRISLLSENPDQASYPPLQFEVGRDSIEILGVYAGLLRPRP